MSALCEAKPPFDRRLFIEWVFRLCTQPSPGSATCGWRIRLRLGSLLEIDHPAIHILYIPENYPYMETQVFRILDNDISVPRHPDCKWPRCVTSWNPL